MFESNELWCKYEKLKHDLKSAGCDGLAKEIYKLQMLLEAKLTKEMLCKRSKDSLK